MKISNWMILLFSFLVLMTACCSNVSKSNTVNEDIMIYTNNEYKFELLLPADWVGKFEVVKSPHMEDSFVVYNINNYKVGAAGTLFSLNIYSEDTWKSEGGELALNTTLKELGKSDGKVYVIIKPGDVNYDVTNESLKKEYQNMSEQFDEIKISFLNIE